MIPIPPSAHTHAHNQYKCHTYKSQINTFIITHSFNCCYLLFYLHFSYAHKTTLNNSHHLHQNFVTEECINSPDQKWKVWMAKSNWYCGPVLPTNSDNSTFWSKHHTRLTAWHVAQLHMPDQGNSWAAKGTETWQMCALECSRDESPTPSHSRVPPPTAQWLGASVPQPDCCPAQSPAASLSDGPPACMIFPENTETFFSCSCLPQIQPLICTSGYHGFVLCSTLGHVGGGNSCEGCYDTHWLTGLWSTQTKVEGIVLEAAWQVENAVP